ncbi:MAG: PilZ domain-containing protein [Amphiplicatus sp.]
MGFGQRLDARLSALSKASNAGPTTSAGSKKRVQRSERRSTYKVGKVRYDGGGDLACVVQDMSATGVKVKLQGAYPLPAKVLLVIGEIGFKKICDVRWQDNDEAGLSFA